MLCVLIELYGVDLNRIIYYCAPTTVFASDCDFIQNEY